MTGPLSTKVPTPLPLFTTKMPSPVVIAPAPPKLLIVSLVAPVAVPPLITTESVSEEELPSSVFSTMVPPPLNVPVAGSVKVLATKAPAGTVKVTMPALFRFVSVELAVMLQVLGASMLTVLVEPPSVRMGPLKAVLVFVNITVDALVTLNRLPAALAVAVELLSAMVLAPVAASA